MTLDEAVAEFEQSFVVTAGEAYVSPDQIADWDRAPSGDQWVTLTSGGLQSAGSPAPAYFTSEDAAVSAWLRAAFAYADKRGGHDLYWLMRPVYREAEYRALDQAAVLNIPALRDTVMMQLGIVHSRLVVSRGKDNEDGEA
ncbi:MAG TPA: hypothetical protein VMV33_17195 [Rhodocyclaceae bacterium]|nr:hypothetical protein [Rhodocyclaceae bacterium]